MGRAVEVGELVEVLMLAVGAMAWETVTHSGPFDVVVVRRIYRLTWWFAPLGLGGAGGLALSRSLDRSAAVPAMLAIVCAAVALTACRLQVEPPGSDRVGRRSISRDRNRRRRLLVLAVAVAACLLSVVLNATFG